MKLKGLLYRRGINGCGVKIFHIRTPYHERFKAACEVHDAAYDAGGDGAARQFVDIAFLERMLMLCDNSKLVFVSICYYVAVRALGWLFFNYKDKNIKK